MVSMLYEAFGLEFQMQKEKIKGLPLYMISGREFYKVAYDDSYFFLVKLPSKSQYGIIALEKQMEKYREAVNAEIVYYFESVSTVQRNALVSKRIPFISGNKQLFLPFMGIMFSNVNREKKPAVKNRMMPATQKLFLYLLYQVKDGSVLKKKAAEDLRLTKTSITRASDQLDAMGLISQEISGRETRMSLKYHGLEAYEAAKAYLINPVQKRLFIKAGEKMDSWILSGESALGMKTMLNVPSYPCYAISKDSDGIDTFESVDIKWQADDAYAEVELWKYDPDLFSSDGVVDPISLIMSMQENVDERVEGALEEYLEEYEW